MAYNLVNKNNMGIVITLILVLFLSQSRFFDFLIETVFGRIILLAFITSISYINKYLGLLAVLLLIIIFNQNNSNTVHAYNFYGSNMSFGSSIEGFDGSGNSIDSSANLINEINSKNQSVADMSQTTTAVTKNSTDNSNKEPFKAREGFCMSDRELHILRGKQSNTVPVFNKAREQGDSVEPTDKSIFSGDYASF